MKNIFISNIFLYLIFNIINAAIPFVLVPILTRYMSPAEYGQVAMFQILLSFLGAIVGLNIVGAANRKYYDDDMGLFENRCFLASCLQIIVLSGVCVFVLIFLVRTHLSALLGLEKGWILCAVLVSALQCIIQMRLGQWQIRNNARSYGVMQISQTILIFLLTLLLVIVYNYSVFGRIISQVIGICVTAFLSIYSLKKSKLLSFFIWNSKYIKEALSFGIPLIPHAAGGFMLMSIDRLVINIELGISNAGIYAVAAQLSTVMMIVFDAINKAYVPWLFERLDHNNIEDKRRIVKFTYAWFAVIAFGIMLAFLFGPKVIAVVAGEQYSSAGQLVGWLVLGQGFVGMYLMVTNYIFYSKKTGFLSLVTIISGLLNVFLLFLCLDFFGLKGAAIAFSISMFFRFIFTWVVAQKRYPMPWLNFAAK